jgi:3'-phosphoadenosine 5'-phosphosulfate sulfotransferase (PAPS reductase)/FAD synthetase
LDESDFYLEDLKSRFYKIDSSNYYLSYSGGRDSHFLYWFIKEYLKDNKIEIVGINTGIEIKEIGDRMKKNCDTILRPVMKPFDIKEQYGIPCVSKSQDEMVYNYRKQIAKGKVTAHYKERIENALESKSYFKINKKLYKALFNGTLHPISDLCCKYMKKVPARNFEEKYNKLPIIGIMGNESIKRKTGIISCFNQKKFFYPIWDLTSEIQHAIENKYGIEIPNIYNYVDQTGCVGCPYGIKNHQAKLNSFNFASKTQQKFLIEYFKESYDFHGFDYLKYSENQE